MFDLGHGVHSMCMYVTYICVCVVDFKNFLLIDVFLKVMPRWHSRLEYHIMNCHFIDTCAI